MEYLWEINFKSSFTMYTNRLHKHALWHVYAFIDFLLWISSLDETFMEWFIISFWEATCSETMCRQKRREEMHK